MAQEVKVCSKSDLALYYTDKQIFDRIVEIDTNNDLNEESIGNEERLMRVFNAVPFLWRAIVSNNKIIGYWNCVPLSEKYLKRVKSGDLREKDIHVKNLNKDLYSGGCEILFDSVCIDKPYQKQKMSGIVIKSILDAFKELPSFGINVSKLWASIWSADGERFFSKLGFEYYVQNKHHGNIYFAEYQKMMQRLEEIVKEYKLYDF